MRHVLQGTLRAQIAPGHHHRVAGLDDLLEVLDRHGRLDLGHEERKVNIGSNEGGSRLTRPAHVVAVPHEGDGHQVDTDLQAALEQAQVGGGRGGEAEPR